MSRVYAVILAVGLTAAAVSGCDEAVQPPAPDATSSATRLDGGKGRAALPPPGETYKIEGRQPGLKGYVVRYDDNFFRGGTVLDATGAAALKKWGVKTIISATPTDNERTWANTNGLTLVEIPFEKENGLSDAQRSRMLEALKGGGPFYAHCHGGNHRGGAFGIVYRVYVQGWDFDKAVKEFDILGGDLESDKLMLESIRPREKTAD